jgi:hypothetical protein
VSGLAAKEDRRQNLSRNNVKIFCDPSFVIGPQQPKEFDSSWQSRSLAAFIATIALWPSLWVEYCTVQIEDGHVQVETPRVY